MHKAASDVAGSLGGPAGGHCKPFRKTFLHWQAGRQESYLVNVGMDKGNIVIAGDAVAQRVEPLIYSLDNHLVRKTVPHMHELCTNTGTGQGRMQDRAEDSLRRMLPPPPTKLLHNCTSSASHKPGMSR